jgi:hypothetical protein
MAFPRLITLLYKIHQVVFKTSSRHIMSSQAHYLLKTLLKQLRPSRFFDDQDSQIDFAWPFDSLKHLFIDFAKVVF